MFCLLGNPEKPDKNYANEVAGDGSFFLKPTCGTRNRMSGIAPHEKLVIEHTIRNRVVL
jgi:hypothetical protein